MLWEAMVKQVAGRIESAMQTDKQGKSLYSSVIQ